MEAILFCHISKVTSLHYILLVFHVKPVKLPLTCDLISQTKCIENCPNCEVPFQKCKVNGL